MFNFACTHQPYDYQFYTVQLLADEQNYAETKRDSAFEPILDGSTDYSDYTFWSSEARYYKAMYTMVLLMTESEFVGFSEQYSTWLNTLHLINPESL